MVTTPGVLDPADPGARSLQLLLQTWCGSASRRGPSANGYDAWRFGSWGPGRKILAAAAADLVWVCAPLRTMRKWLRRLAETKSAFYHPPLVSEKGVGIPHFVHFPKTFYALLILAIERQSEHPSSFWEVKINLSVIKFIIDYILVGTVAYNVRFVGHVFSLIPVQIHIIIEMLRPIYSV